MSSSVTRFVIRGSDLDTMSIEEYSTFTKLVLDAVENTFHNGLTNAQTIVATDHTSLHEFLSQVIRRRGKEGRAHV